MDFALTEEQHAIVELARQILTDRCTQDRLREVESGIEWFDRELWADLARADLLGIALPEDVGGGGFGYLEACLLLAEVGRAVAPVPLLATSVAALTVAEHGTALQRDHLLPGVIAGEVVLAPALAEPDSTDLRTPTARATRTAGGWLVDGAKTAVPAAHLAAALLVPVSTDEGVRVLLVEPDATGVTLSRQDTFNHEPTFHVGLSGVAVDDAAVVGDLAADGQAVLDWLVDRAVVGVCAVAAGVADASMRLTAGYASERKQFDRPIGSFQAVGHRMADCYVDNEAMQLSMRVAASHLDGRVDHDRTQVDLAVAVAKYWASYGGSRIGHAGLHVHGGISIDLDYPMHRYFLWSKQLELTLGPGSQQLARVGAILAAAPA
jgi:alkylation response protein AidB-like acyl-CoA dehydrogenase